MRGSIVGACLAIACLLAATGCGGQSPPDRGQDVIRLGALLPMSGRNSPSGIGMAAAARLAVDDANRAGGVLGRRVEIVVGDDACDPGTAVEAANRLVARDITVSVGGYCSSATAPTLKIFHQAGIPMIIPVANSTDLLAPRDDSVFLISGTTATEAAFALSRLRRLNAHRLTVIDDGTSASATLAASTADQATEGAAGGQLAFPQRITLSQGGSSYLRIADEVLTQHADAVYYTGYYAEAAQLIRDLRTVRYTGAIVMANGCVVGNRLDNLTAVESEGVYGTALLMPDLVPEVRPWAVRFQATVGNPPGPSTMQAYDAVRVALDAIGRTGSLDHAAVRRAIAATSGAGLLTGPVRFNSDGSRADPRFLLVRAHRRAFALAG